MQLSATIVYYYVLLVLSLLLLYSIHSSFDMGYYGYDSLGDGDIPPFFVIKTARVWYIYGSNADLWGLETLVFVEDHTIDSDRKGTRRSTQNQNESVSDSSITSNIKSQYP